MSLLVCFKQRSLYLFVNNIVVYRFSSFLKRLLETLNRGPDKQKARLSEYARKMTVLRINEKSLARRYTILSESEESLRKECSKLKDDITLMENAVTERIGYLTRYKVSSFNSYHFIHFSHVSYYVLC